MCIALTLLSSSSFIQTNSSCSTRIVCLNENESSRCFRQRQQQITATASLSPSCHTAPNRPHSRSHKQQQPNTLTHTRAIWYNNTNFINVNCQQLRIVSRYSSCSSCFADKLHHWVVAVVAGVVDGRYPIYREKSIFMFCIQQHTHSRSISGLSHSCVRALFRTFVGPFGIFAFVVL